MRRRKRENGSSSGSSGFLFPIGLGLGALAAIALFLGFSVGPFDASGDTPGTTVASGKLPTPRAGKSPVPTASGETSRTLPAETVAAAPAAPASAAEGDVAALAGLGTPSGPNDAPAGTAGASGLPSVDDPEAADLFGGRVAMVSSAVPRVVVLADGTSLVPGERLPGGHRIIGIERDRILLERDGAEWQVRVP